MSAIVLPGGAGLVGQNLLPRLKAAGFSDLTVIDKHAANLAILRHLHPDVRVHEADLSEPGGWEADVTRADAVIMLQAQIGGINHEAFTRNNITATGRILAAIDRARPPRLIHVSSSVVGSAAEDDYSRSKRLQEELVRASGLPAVILRPTLMFGWFDRKHLGWLARFMARVPVFPVPGNGRFSRQPLYAGDFASIILACLTQPVTPGAYDISGLEKIDYIDIIRAIRAVTRARAVIAPVPYRLFWGLLWLWASFDRDPPFTTAQLEALVTREDFPVIDWPQIFTVTPTPFTTALRETFTDPRYSRIVLEF